MSRAAREQTYWMAWRTHYTYTFEHMSTLMRRAGTTGISLGKMLSMLLSFWSLSPIEHTHPLEGGYFRRKVRTERRLPTVPAWRFWPGFAMEFVGNHARIGVTAAHLLRLRQRLKRDPAARDFRGLALTPLCDDSALEMLTVTEAARGAARSRLRSLATAG